MPRSADASPGLSHSTTNSKQEVETAEFERKKREWEDVAEAKTAKNRAKRQKKKERAKGKGSEKDNDQSGVAGGGPGASGDKPDAPFNKRRLVSGKELVFRRPGEDDDDEEGDEDVGPTPSMPASIDATGNAPPVPIIDAPRITIHEDD